MILDKEKYIKVRAAQAQGARTVKEVKDMTGLVIDNDEESFKIYTNKAIHSMYPKLRNKMLHIINK